MTLALWRLTVLEARFFTREPQAMLWTLLFPLFMLMFFGSAFGEVGYVEFLVPGLIGMNLMSISFFATGSVLAGYRERGVLRRLRVTPLKPVSFVLAHLLNRSAIAFIQAIALVIFAYLVFGAAPRGSGIALAAVVIIGLFTFMAMGFAIAGVTTSRASAQGLSQLCFLPMLFLGGAYFPLSSLPERFRAVGTWLPIAPFLDALRGVYIHGADLSTVAGAVLMTSAWGIASLIAAVLLFRWE